MSLAKYLETKSRSRIRIVMDAYTDKLEADLASLVIKPNEQLIDAKKNIVNIREVSKILSELNYPLADEFNMVMRTGISKKVSHARITFRNWAEFSKADQNLVNYIESIVFQYEANLFDKTFGPEQVDEVVKSSIEESKSILEKIANQINLAITALPSWGNHKVTVEAMSPEKGWVVLEAKVIVGEAFKAEFIIDHTPLEFRIKNIKKESLPPSMEIDVNALLNKLSKNQKYNKILTLYITRPLGDSKYFEMIKRDLALGIKAVLPNYTLLTTLPLTQDQDVWKVRIEEKYIYEHLVEGDYKEFHIIGDDAPIRWIEKYEKEIL